MDVSEEYIRDLGYQALRETFHLRSRHSPGTGAFSGSNHRPKGEPGGGKFRTKAGRSHAVETRPGGRSLCLLSDQQRLTSYVRQYIAELSEMEQAWVNMCYRSTTPRDALIKFRRTYVAAYLAESCERCKPGTRAVVREIIDFRMGQMAGNIPMSARFESHNGTISRQLWSKTYATHWDRICGDLDRIDANVLYKIGVKIYHH